MSSNGRDEHRGLVECAAAYLSEIKVLETCSVHGYTYRGNDELDGNYGLAVYEWKKKGAGAVPWAKDLSQPQFCALLKEAYDEYCGDGCIGNPFLRDN